MTPEQIEALAERLSERSGWAIDQHAAGPVIEALLADGWAPPRGPMPDCPHCGIPVAIVEMYDDPHAGSRAGTVRPCGHGLVPGMRYVEIVAPWGYVIERRLEEGS